MTVVRIWVVVMGSIWCGSLGAADEFMGTRPDPSEDARSAREDLGGMSFVPPARWRREEAQSLNNGSELSRGAERLDIRGLWIAGDSAPGAQLSLAVSAQYTRVSESELETARTTLENEAHDLRFLRDFHLEEIGVTQVDGLPAYRICSRMNVAGASVRQLQYVVAGAETYILTFACPTSSYGDLEPLFEDTVESVTVEARPTLLDTTPMWLWGGVLGGLLGGVLGLRSKLRLLWNGAR